MIIARKNIVDSDTQGFIYTDVMYADFAGRKNLSTIALTDVSEEPSSVVLMS